MLERLVDAALLHNLARDRVPHVELAGRGQLLQSLDISRERGLRLLSRGRQPRRVRELLLVGPVLGGREELRQAFDLLYVHAHPAFDRRVQSTEQRFDVVRHPLEASGDVRQTFRGRTRVVDEQHEDAVADVIAGARHLLEARPVVEAVAVAVHFRVEHELGQVQIELLVEVELAARELRELGEQSARFAEPLIELQGGGVGQSPEFAFHTEHDAPVGIAGEM